MKVEIRKGSPRAIRWAAVEKAVLRLNGHNYLKITPTNGEKPQAIAQGIRNRFNGTAIKIHKKCVYVTLR